MLSRNRSLAQTLVAPAIAGALCLGVAACGPDGDDTYRSPGAPVIIISLDTLRPDHLGVYGYERPTSPHLDALAQESVVFDRAFHSGGGTLPSHMTLMTGLQPLTHGVGPSKGNSLPAGRTTLAELLGAAGYRTAGFADSGWMRAKFGFAQGFDVYDDAGGRFAAILPKSLDWLGSHHGESFFLFVHTYDIHSEWRQLPYDCPEPWVSHFVADMEVEFDGCREGSCATQLLSDLNRRLRAGEITAEEAFSDAELEFVKGLYDGCVRYADDRAGVLLQKLKDLGVYDQSLIVVLSDHGEEFLEHGMLIHDQGGYDEIARIPLMIKLPGGRFAGTRVPHIVAMVDVLPTVLDVVDLPVPEEVQGQSLIGTLREGEPIRDLLHMYDVVATDDWKYIEGTGELFDLQQDAEETANVIDEHPEVIEALQPRLDELRQHDRRSKWAFEYEVGEGPGSVELTAEEIEELRALGYLLDEEPAEPEPGSSSSP